MKEIRKCPKCLNYTFKEKCPKCGENTRRVIPPKFSPDDKYGDYRRKIKKKILYFMGLI